MSHETFVTKTGPADTGTSPLARFLLLAVVFMLVAGLGVPSSAREPGVTMVVLGDSLVAGYGLGPGESFPEQLQKALDEKGKNIVIENAGVSGDTSSGGLARLDWSVPAGTDIVLVELGANDALRGISPEVTRQNLETIITRLKERGILVLLAGMQAPPNMGSDYESRFNAIYPELAEKYAVPLYPFFLEGVAAVPDLNQADGIHPTAEGITKMVGNMLPFFKSSIPEF